MTKTPYQRIPLIGRFLISDSRLKKLSLEEQAKQVALYQKSLGLDTLIKADTFKSNAYLTYLQNHKSDTSQFTNLSRPDGQKLGSLIEGADPDSTAIKTQLSAALKIDPNTVTQRAKYEKDLHTLQAHIQKIGKGRQPEDLIAYLQDLRQENITSIKTQQQLELNAIDAKFNDAAFKNALVSKGFTPALQNGLKGEMKAVMKTEHQKQVAEFDKEIKGVITTLSDSASEQKRWVAYLATMAAANNNKDIFNKKKLEQMMANMPTANANAFIAVNIDPEQAVFKNITPDQVDRFRSLTGRKVTHETDANGKDVYTTKINSNFREMFNKGYNLDFRQNTKAEMLTIAMAVRASNPKGGVVMDINGFDKPTKTQQGTVPSSRSLELAREAYEACLESGFPPDKITINIDGVKKSAQQLFENESNRLQRSQAKGQAVKQQEQKIFNPSPASATNVAEIKAQVVALRDQAPQRVPGHGVSALPPSGP